MIKIHALGEWLVKGYGVGQLMMLRLIGAARQDADILSLRVKLIDPRHGWLQVLRIFFSAVDTFAFYDATRIMPLADVMTFDMATPLIVTALSAPLLGEKVERFRWIAVLIGFVGVLVALRPSPQMFSWAAPLALFGNDVRAQSDDHPRSPRPPLAAAGVWQFAGSGLIGAAIVPFAWTTRTMFDLGLMFLVGIVSVACFIFIVRRWRWPAPLCSRHCNIRRLFGGDHGLARLARRPDAADTHRQRHDHQQRPLRRHARKDGRQRCGVSRSSRSSQ